MNYPIVTDIEWRQRLYEQIRDSGESHNVAEMCALNEPCGLHGTDSINFKGVASADPLEGYHPMVRARYEQAAREQGVDLNGKKLIGSMMRHPMDIKGAVFDSTVDLKKEIERRGWESHGMVESKGVEPIGENPMDKPYRCADDIVAETIEREHTQEEWQELSQPERAEIFTKTQDRLSGVEAL